LNNTVIASPRILIPLLEIHQTRKGSVKIPEALRPYMKGMERIEK
jgi:seryl-tRNA synthetase